MAERCFIPDMRCTVASGDCFRLSRCLDRCKTKAPRDNETRIDALERRIRELESSLADGLRQVAPTPGASTVNAEGSPASSEPDEQNPVSRSSLPNRSVLPREPL